MGPHQGSAEGKENLPRPAGHTPPNASQDPISILGSQGTLHRVVGLAHPQLGSAAHGWGGLCGVAGGSVGLGTARLAHAPSGCAWFGSHARGQAGLFVTTVVRLPGTWLCTGRGFAGPPSRCVPGPHGCATSTPGLRHLSGRRGTHRRGLCPEDGCAGWAQPGDPSSTGWLPRDRSFPAALPCRFLPSCSQPKFSPSD